MNPIVKNALNNLQNANYAGYFEEIDKLTLSAGLDKEYKDLSMKFIMNDIPFNFYITLSDFAKRVEEEVNKAD